MVFRKDVKCPFDENALSSLLFMEEIHSKSVGNKEIIRTLIQKYSKLVEYYDIVKDPIKIYFMDKMQTILFNLKGKMDGEIHSAQNINKTRFHDGKNNKLMTSLKKIQKQNKNANFYEMRKNQLFKVNDFM